MPRHKFWNPEPYVTLTSIRSCYTSLLTDSHFDLRPPFQWAPPPSSHLISAIKLLFSVRRSPASNCSQNTCTLFIYSFPFFFLYFFPVLYCIFIFLNFLILWLPFWLLIYRRFRFSGRSQRFWSQSRSQQFISHISLSHASHVPS